MDDASQKAADDQVRLTKNPQQDFQAAYNAGGHFKEQLESIAASFKGTPHSAEASRGKEIKEIEEIPQHPEIEPEVEGYMERVEKDPELQKALADDYVKAIGMQPTSSSNPQVKIPLTNDQIQAGLHHKVWEAMRWLAEWCVRQMKMLRLKHA